MENNNLNKKNNIPDASDDLFGEDIIDVELEDLSFDLKGNGKVTEGNGKVKSSDDATTSGSSDAQKDSSNNNDTNSPALSRDENPNQHDNEMIDTSDDASSDDESQEQNTPENNDNLPEESSNPESNSSEDTNNNDENNGEKGDKNKDENKEKENGDSDKEKDKKEDDSQDDKKKNDSEDKKGKDDDAPRPSDNGKKDDLPDKSNINDENKDVPKSGDKNKENNPQGTTPTGPNQNDNLANQPPKNNLNNTENNKPNSNAKKDNTPKNSNQRQGNKAPNNSVNSRNKKDNNTPSSNKNLKGKSHSNSSGFRKKASDGLKDAGKKAGSALQEGVKKLNAVIPPKVKLIIAGVVLAVIIFLIIIFAVINASGAITTPGQGNDFKDEFSSFSERDKKILEEVNSINGISKNNAELAVYTLLFPYFESLQDGSINAYLNGDSSDLSDEEQKEYEENSNNSEIKQKILESFGCDDLCQELLGTDGVNQIIKAYAKPSFRCKVKQFFNKDADCTEDISLEELLNDENEDNDENKDNNPTETDDPYLKLLAKKNYQKKLETLLSNLSSSAEDGDYESETAFFEYLKTDYFESDAGYRALFIQTDDKEGLENAIIEQLKTSASLYEVYIADHCKNSFDFQSGGQITPSDEDIKNMMMGNIVIDLLEAGCGNTKKCSSYYSSPISLEKYIKGVVYEEFGSSNDLEQIKAQMVAAKSYTLTKREPSVTDNGVYVMKMRWSTADHDYCDYETGCKDVKENYGYNNVNDCLYADGTDKCKHWANRGPASAEKVELYDKAWEETKNVYIVDSDGKPRGNYMEGCSKGTCMDQAELEKMHNMDYQSILKSFYTKYTIAIQEGEFVTALIGSSNKVCPTNPGDSNFIYYAQNDYKDVGFCHLDIKEDSSKSWCDSKAHSICTSGCSVTAMAMAVATAIQDSSITPEVINNETRKGTDCGENGALGSLVPYIASLHGLEAKGISNLSVEKTKDKIIEALDAGNLVIANTGSTYKNGYSASHGHYVVIRGYSDNNFYVADPWYDSSMNSKCEEFNEKNYCTKLSVNYTDLIENVKQHNDKFYIISGGIPFNSGGGVGTPGVATGTLGYPVSGVKGCDASDYPNYSSGSGRYHGGTDINKAANGGKPVEGKDVLAADGGVVKTVKKLNYSYGNHVIIDHGNGYTTLYAHMQKGSITVKEGDKVQKGQKIGKVGSTGKSSGPHLHIELRINDSHSNTLNPCKYIGTNKKYSSK